MFGSPKRKQPRYPSSEERALLDQFANCTIGLNELLIGLHGEIEINFDEDVRSLTSNFLVAEPGIRIQLSQIEQAIAINAKGEISNRELMDWATFILLCDAYIWDEADEDEIADKLHELSLPQVFLRPEEPPDLSR